MVFFVMWAEACHSMMNNIQSYDTVCYISSMMRDKILDRVNIARSVEGHQHLIIIGG